MGVRDEWNKYTLFRYVEQPDGTKLKSTVTQAEKDRTITGTVTQAEKDRTVSNDVSVVQSDPAKLKSTVTQFDKDRTVSNDVSIVQSDHDKLKATTKITDGTNTASITDEGYQDVKTHTPDKCFTDDYADAQTDQTIITPTSGKKIRIISVFTSVGANDTNVTVSFVTSGDVVFKLYTIKKAVAIGNAICKDGAVNEAVKLTCPATTFISIAYDEVD